MHHHGARSRLAVNVCGRRLGRATAGGLGSRRSEAIDTDQEDHLPAITAALARAGDRERWKALLIPCAYHVDAAYQVLRASRFLVSGARLGRRGGPTR